MNTKPEAPPQRNKPEITHAEGCWAWGPQHYHCALNEIKNLQDELHGLRTLCEEMLSELYGYRAAEHLINVTAAIKAKATGEANE